MGLREWWARCTRRQVLAQPAESVDVAAVADRVGADVCREIRAVQECTEQATLAVGQELQSIVDSTRSFIDQIRRDVGELDGGGSDGVAEVLARQCQTVAAFLEELRKAAQTQRAAATELMRTARAVVEAAHSVSGVALTSKVLCMNTMIEAGRLGEAGLPMVVIADQMRALSERMGRTNKEISASMSNLLPVLEQVDAGTEQMDHRAGEFSLEFERQRQDVAAVAERVQRTARGALGAADGRLATIVDHSHRALIQLQTQDIVSQRLQRAANLVEGLAPALQKKDGSAVGVSARVSAPSQLVARGKPADQLAQDASLLTAMAGAPVAATYLSDSLPAGEEPALAAGEMQLF